MLIKHCPVNSRTIQDQKGRNTKCLQTTPLFPVFHFETFHLVIWLSATKFPSDSQRQRLLPRKRISELLDRSCHITVLRYQTGNLVLPNILLVGYLSDRKLNIQ